MPSLQIYYMLLHRKGLSHPVQNFGRGFLVALSFMGCLHIANIAIHVSRVLALCSAFDTLKNTLLCKRFTPVLQFLSFAPAMGHWIVDYKVSLSYVHNVVLACSILSH